MPKARLGSGTVYDNLQYSRDGIIIAMGSAMHTQSSIPSSRRRPVHRPPILCSNTTGLLVRQHVGQPGCEKRDSPSDRLCRPQGSAESFSLLPAASCLKRQRRLLQFRSLREGGVPGKWPVQASWGVQGVLFTPPAPISPLSPLCLQGSPSALALSD